MCLIYSNKMIITILSLAALLQFTGCACRLTISDIHAPVTEEKFATLIGDVDNLITTTFYRTAQHLLYDSRKICLTMTSPDSIQGPEMDEARATAITCYMMKVTTIMRDLGNITSRA
jgi:UDP-N-acetylmuramyl tripeptide synthase